MDFFSAITFASIRIGIAIYNQYQNQATTEKIKAEQREIKRQELQNNQQRDMERFLRSCQLQEKLELEKHIYKIRTIRNDFLDSFDKMIHQENLETGYRLNISPYIIQHAVIPLSSENIEDTRQELFCILTGSNNHNFNRDMLPYLDDAICDLLSKYWNESSNHTVCYYQNIWDTSCPPFSNEDIENLKPLIPTPTITLTPFFSEEESHYLLSIKLNVWGMGKGLAIAIDFPTDVRFNTLPDKYTSRDIDEIIKKLVPCAICLIGQVADIFYWTNFYLPPRLPYLLGKNSISVPESVKEQYAIIYSKLYNQLAIGFQETSNTEEELQTVADIMDINMYNHPERSVQFLRSFITLSKDPSIATEAIKNSMIALYRAKTDKHADRLEDIDASLLHKSDFTIISQYADMAKKCRAVSIVPDLMDIIRRNVISWK